MFVRDPYRKSKRVGDKTLDFPKYRSGSDVPYLKTDPLEIIIRTFNQNPEGYFLGTPRPTPSKNGSISYKMDKCAPLASLKSAANAFKKIITGPKQKDFTFTQVNLKITTGNQQVALAKKSVSPDIPVFDKIQQEAICSYLAEASVSPTSVEERFRIPGVLEQGKLADKDRRRFLAALKNLDGSHIEITFQTSKRNLYINNNNCLNSIVGHIVFRFERMLEFVTHDIFSSAQLGLYVVYGLMSSFQKRYGWFQDPKYAEILNNMMLAALVYESVFESLMLIESLRELSQLKHRRKDPKYIGYEAYKPQKSGAIAKVGLRTFTAGRAITALCMQKSLALQMMLGPLAWGLVVGAQIAHLSIYAIDIADCNREILFEKTKQQEHAAIIAALLEKDYRTEHEQKILEAHTVAYVESMDREDKLQKKKRETYKSVCGSILIIGAVSAIMLSPLTGGLLFGALILATATYFAIKYFRKYRQEKQQSAAYLKAQQAKMQPQKDINRLKTLQVQMRLAQFERQQENVRLLIRASAHYNHFFFFDGLFNRNDAVKGQHDMVQYELYGYHNLFRSQRRYLKAYQALLDFKRNHHEVLNQRLSKPGPNTSHQAKRLYQYQKSTRLAFSKLEKKLTAERTQFIQNIDLTRKCTEYAKAENLGTFASFQRWWRLLFMSHDFFSAEGSRLVSRRREAAEKQKIPAGTITAFMNHHQDISVDDIQILAAS